MDAHYDDVKPLQVREVRDLCRGSAHGSHHADQMDNIHRPSITREQRGSCLNGSASLVDGCEERGMVDSFHFGKGAGSLPHSGTWVPATAVSDQKPAKGSSEVSHGHWVPTDVSEASRATGASRSMAQQLPHVNPTVPHPREQDKQASQDYISNDWSESPDGVDEVVALQGVHVNLFECAKCS